MKSVPELIKEYSSLCVSLGDLEHQLDVISLKKSELLQKMSDIDAEFVKVQEFEAQKKADAEKIAKDIEAKKAAKVVDKTVPEISPEGIPSNVIGIKKD
ncbi:MAG: hypothetical protein LLG04_07280 [Parachlamydia sp.]|nr:hypothetical protein [Parachlamydia sp.]